MPGTGEMTDLRRTFLHCTQDFPIVLRRLFAPAAGLSFLNSPRAT